MTRLQHYVEFVYLVVAAMALSDVIQLRRRDWPRVVWGERARLVAAVAVAPITLAWVALEYLRCGKDA